MDIFRDAESRVDALGGQVCVHFLVQNADHVSALAYDGRSAPEPWATFAASVGRGRPSIQARAAWTNVAEHAP